MRCVPLIAMAALLLAACSKDNSTAKQATVAATSVPQLYVNADPKLLLLTEAEVPAGKWKISEGSNASLQYFRSFDRDAPDSAPATGATRIAISGRIYQNQAESADDTFQQCMGLNGKGYLQATISIRGFAPEEMRFSQ